MVSSRSDRKSLLAMSTVFFVVVFGTILVTYVARGYRLDFQNGPGLKSTGLLSATSKPKGASVYINDALTTATDDTINLPPGDYIVKIVKDGFLPWSKKVHIKKEVVFQTDAQLFRSVPDLKPITQTGAINPADNPDGNTIVFAVASASATRDNGLYIVNTYDSPLGINRSTSRQIAPNFPGVDWTKFDFSFSPDNKNLLALSKTQNISYLLPLDKTITQKDLYDVTLRLPVIYQEWADQTITLLASITPKLPSELRDIVATDSPEHIQFSSDDTKVLYLTTKSGQLKENIVSPPPAQSTQAQTRNIQKGNYYIYDIKDDTNFLVGNSSTISQPFWLPNSVNIAYVENQAIVTTEYDATNKHTLFAGAFDPKIVYPWTDGSKIAILTAPYRGAATNLYTISIR